MILKKLSTLDQMIYDMSNKKEYNLYYCDEHGMFAVRKDNEEQFCQYCKKECDKYEQYE